MTQKGIWGQELPLHLPTFTRGRTKSSNLSVNPVRKQLAAAPRGDNFTVSLPAHPALTPHAGCESRCPCFIFFYHLQELSSRPPLYAQVLPANPACPDSPKYVAAVLFPPLIQVFRAPHDWAHGKRKEKRFCVWASIDF